MRKEKMKKYFKIILLFLLAVCFSLFVLKKIDLTAVDLGRHLRNGQDFFQGDFGFLRSNFYSYSYPDFSFLNHHWAAGAIFFSVLKIASFSGLHFFFLILGLATLLMAFQIAEKELNFKIAFFLSIALIPLFAYRKEIRAEIFSCFFAMAFFWILWKRQKGVISPRFLFLLPILQIFWVNTHIYFFLGPLIISTFLLEKIIFFLISKIKKTVYNNQELKNILLVFVFCFAASFCNLFGLKGVLHPLNVYGNYGYRVLEEQSVWFLEKLNIHHPAFLLFKAIVFLLILSFIALLIKNRKRFSPAIFCLAAGFSAMAYISIRNISIFGFFALPILAINIKGIFMAEKEIQRENTNFCSPNFILNLNFSKTICAMSVLLIFISAIITYGQEISLQKENFGVGILSGNELSATFFKQEKIKGPIFNNYDIGGYLIYYLYPQERVFVDNRPEVYPASFFSDAYIPMQENDIIWKKKMEEYNFNAIFFSHKDYTPWGQNFLISRVNDPLWAPVFADPFAVIFLKRNETNKNIIDRCEIPKSNFTVTKS